MPAHPSYIPPVIELTVMSMCAMRNQLLGSLFVYFVAKAVLFVRYICTTVRRRYILCMIVAAIVATATYPAAYLRKSDRDVINDLFQVSAGAIFLHALRPVHRRVTVLPTC